MLVEHDLTKRLKRVEDAVRDLREYLEDEALSAEDREAIAAYEADKAAGRLVTHEQLKKRLRG